MHLSDMLGGFDFYEETHTELLYEPRFVNRGSVTNRVFVGQNTRILEINSKSGLYPLYMAYSIWYERCREWERQGFFEVDKMTIEEQYLAWDDVIANNIFVVCKTPMAVSITKRTLIGFRDVKQINTRCCSNLVETLKTASNEFAGNIVRGHSFWHNKNVEKEMKFSAIVGNPPYQVMDGGAQASATPVYNYFVNVAKQISPSYFTLIMPARWYSGGRGLDDFRDEMLNDIHISRLDDFMNPEIVFPSTNIRSGVCYFLWEKQYDNRISKVTVTNHGLKGIENTSKRPMKYDGVSTFIRDSRSISILQKVKSNEYLVDHVSPLRPFGFRGFFINDKNFHEDNKGLKDPILCYGKGLKIGYVERELISVHKEWVDNWKVMISRANNIATELSDDNLNSFICRPKCICTESYLVIGSELNLDKEQCMNICNYLNTRFARFMHSIAKSSQDATSKTFQYVPLLDFHKTWTDVKLYQMYGITSEEQEYIEARIKPMG